MEYIVISKTEEHTLQAMMRRRRFAMWRAFSSLRFFAPWFAISRRSNKTEAWLWRNRSAEVTNEYDAVYLLQPEIPAKMDFFSSFLFFLGATRAQVGYCILFRGKQLLQVEWKTRQRREREVDWSWKINNVYLTAWVRLTWKRKEDNTLMCT